MHSRARNFRTPDVMENAWTTFLHRPVGQLTIAFCGLPVGRCPAVSAHLYSTRLPKQRRDLRSSELVFFQSDVSLLLWAHFTLASECDSMHNRGITFSPSIGYGHSPEGKRPKNEAGLAGQGADHRLSWSARLRSSPAGTRTTDHRLLWSVGLRSSLIGCQNRRDTQRNKDSVPQTLVCCRDKPERSPCR